jgi:three-Cys-motif partner protein
MKLKVLDFKEWMKKIMAKKEFFDKQSDLTASKIMIYRQYIKEYLAKVLMYYGKCYMADFFCGCGKNGKKDGSPLVLLGIAKKMLNDSTLKKKQPNAEIVIVFSDKNKIWCNELSECLQKYSKLKQIKILGPFCKSFCSIKEEAIEAFSNVSVPKFFFLDPFTYSDVGINDIKDLMDIPAAEVLFFVPIFHLYRFVNRANKVEPIKKFLEEYSDRKYFKYSDIKDLIESIRQKMLKHIDLKYVRYVILDDGARKNALFYLTKHISGMLLMNNLSWKYAEDGVVIKVKNYNIPTLFDSSLFSENYNNLKKLLKEYIIKKKRLTNVEIIEFVAKIGFRTQFARLILKEMKSKDLVRIKYKKSNKKRGFYVADGNWNEELATIIYQGGKNGD